MKGHAKLIPMTMRDPADVGADVAADHEQCSEEPEDRTGRPHDPYAGSEQRHGDRAAEAGEEVQDHEPPVTEHRLEDSCRSSTARAC